MELVTIRKTSLMYHIATVYGAMSKHNVFDICTLRGSMAFGLLMISFIIMISSAVLYGMVLLPVAYFIVVFQQGFFFDPGELLTITALVYAIALVFLAIIAACVGWSMRVDEIEERERSGQKIEGISIVKLVLEMYRSAKEKYCKQVVVVD